MTPSSPGGSGSGCQASIDRQTFRKIIWKTHTVFSEPSDSSRHFSSNQSGKYSSTDSISCGMRAEHWAFYFHLSVLHLPVNSGVLIWFAILCVRHCKKWSKKQFWYMTNEMVFGVWFSRWHYRLSGLGSIQFGIGIELELEFFKRPELELTFRWSVIGQFHFNSTNSYPFFRPLPQIPPSSPPPPPATLHPP